MSGGRPGPTTRLGHHDLCFGCGLANPFGLMLELERVGEDTVAGRFFVKQDLQGADGRRAHPGVLSAALQEAMRLAGAQDAPVRRLEVDFTGEAPVGAFVGIEAQVERHDGRGLRARAEAFDPADRRTLARAAARFPSTGGDDA